MARRALQQLKGYQHQDGGLVIFYTGYGKGKTTAAMGVAIRAAGYGYPVKVIQFIKGEWPTGEKNFILDLQKANVEELGKIEFIQAGKGFVKILGDKKPITQHEDAARVGLEEAHKTMRGGKHKLLVLDEIVTAIEEKVLAEKDVLDLIDARPKKLTLILTGHKKYPRIIAKADLVTEMKKIKHPFEKGILAKQGIDY